MTLTLTSTPAGLRLALSFHTALTGPVTVLAAAGDGIRLMAEKHEALSTKHETKRKKNQRKAR